MKKKLFSKVSSAAVSAAIALNALAVAPTVVSSAESTTVKYEFEDADFTTGTSAMDDNSSASGGAYLKMESGTITVTINTEAAGLYNLTIYAGGIGGAKQQNMKLNGASIGVLSIPSSSGFEAITVPSVKLAEGENTFEIISSWGWSNFDYMTVEEATLPPITASQNTPCDPSATEETKNLMSYLASVYGSHIITGQQEIYMYGPHDFEYEFEYIKEKTGVYPAIRGFDYLNEANILGYGTEDGTTDRIISWVNDKNGIATASWHLTVPKDMTNYKVGDSVSYENATYSCTWNDDKTENTATNFNTANVLVEGTVEHEYYMAALEEISTYLTKLQDAGVPLIFRPLHEAEGGGGETGSWFWWGAAGSDVYKQIWQLTYKTLTETYDLHNIIWEWNSYAFDTSADWYPGDEYVDLIGYDKYSCTKYLAENNWQPSYEHDDASYTSTFYTIMEKFNSKKMVAMAENDSFSTVENLIADKAGWLYFCTWYDGGSDNINFLSGSIFNTEEDLVNMYTSDYAITLDELPTNLYKEAVIVTTDPDATTVTTTTTTADPDATTTTTAYEFQNKSYTVKLPETDRGTMTVTIEGAPTASIGGGLGYGTNQDDWVNLEWSGDADSDGLLTVTIDISEIPETFTTAEFQIWWSNVWDNTTKTSSDTDCEMTDYTFSSVSDDTTSVDEGLYGDANGDGEVSVADATLIMQVVANPDSFSIKDEDKPYADVSGDGDGITAADALAIQKYLIGEISKLPE